MVGNGALKGDSCLTELSGAIFFAPHSVRSQGSLSLKKSLLVVENLNECWWSAPEGTLLMPIEEFCIEKQINQILVLQAKRIFTIVLLSGRNFCKCGLVVI